METAADGQEGHREAVVKILVLRKPVFYVVRAELGVGVGGTEEQNVAKGRLAAAI